MSFYPLFMLLGVESLFNSLFDDSASFFEVFFHVMIFCFCGCFYLHKFDACLLNSTLSKIPFIDFPLHKMSKSIILNSLFIISPWNKKPSFELITVSLSGFCASLTSFRYVVNSLFKSAQNERR